MTTETRDNCAEHESCDGTDSDCRTERGTATSGHQALLAAELRRVATEQELTERPLDLRIHESLMRSLLGGSYRSDAWDGAIDMLEEDRA